MPNSIIITGGTQRLGLAIAENLCKKGYEVLVSYRKNHDSHQQLREKGVKLVQADFSTQGGIDDFIRYVKQHYCALRGIIHNASDWAAEGDDDEPAALFNRMMQVHASAPYQMNLAFQSLLTQSDEVTDIIHMTDYVQEKGSKKHIAYAASKAALHNLTLSFAASLAPKVKVNSIAPALLMFNEHDDDVYKQKALKKSLLEICPGAQEAVKAVNFLLDSDYVTGRTMSLDGGRHLK
ncbi:MAG: dihydromonapterin reductase [Paraglaciecola sp.]|nr:dihydromonapterin reductase [Paraglaciecola sp.]